jgi:arsenic resistance protein ArsH
MSMSRYRCRPDLLQTGVRYPDARDLLYYLLDVPRVLAPAQLAAILKGAGIEQDSRRDRRSCAHPASPRGRDAHLRPERLPLPDDANDSHHKVQDLRNLVTWSEGMVWCSPERHGPMSGIIKAQIDWIPLTLGAVRPTQGKTLA